MDKKIIIGVAILVVIGMALYGTFASGISIWKRVSQRSVTEDVGLIFKNMSYDLRGDPYPIPRTYVGPWLNSTIEPDLMRVPLEFGCGRQ